MGRTSTYPIEFRHQAASLVIDGHRSVRDVARELGINHETLRNWVARARKDRAAGPTALGDDERMELARLRRRVAELELEKEILKKAAVFFARETGR
ncbi:transposase [Quadrisphaera setariae]|uniref:Transposase n=1 Tax=Quadrisphaera setariae TaxID=2593304 RepID=A0A5C8Z248_9ACTN|nr:transposase [Quadrisphaera setariae]TXR51263.1 transposase [Quadrisphaera setariae]